MYRNRAIFCRHKMFFRAIKQHWLLICNLYSGKRNRCKMYQHKKFCGKYQEHRNPEWFKAYSSSYWIGRDGGIRPTSYFH